MTMFAPNANAFRLYGVGTETGSSALEAQDTDHSINVDSNVSFQVRVRIDEVNGVGGTNMDDYSIRYDKNSTATFTDVPTSDSGDGIRAAAAGLTNDAATTDRSSDPISNPGSGSFVAGEQSDDGLVDNMELTASNFTELVWGIEFISANVSNNDTFDFEVGNKLEVNNVTPRLTIEKTAAASIFEPIGEGGAAGPSSYIIGPGGIIG